MEQILVWIASGLCCVAVIWEFGLGDSRSAWITSSLALPFYAAGIAQWFIFGVVYQHHAVALSCFVQLLLLVPMLVRYIEFQRRDN